MLTILSPAKNMRAGCTAHPVVSRPVFLEQAAQINQQLRPYSPWQLETLLQVNPQLALAAWDKIQAFDPTQPGDAALTSYYGLLYQNLDGASLTEEEFAFAQQHLRILSGFYGVLRPGDGILPYRLEVQTRLPMGDSKNLYAWWGDALWHELYQTGEPVVNLASREYSKAICSHLQPGNRFITCDFLHPKGGKLRMGPTSAKMARGQMARFIVTNRIDQPEGLQEFCWNDYVFVPQLSSGEKYSFVQGWEG